MTTSHRHWTARELAIIVQSPSPAEAFTSLPNRTVQAVESRWRKEHPEATMATSRPPQTPEECQVARLLAHVRMICREAQVRPDVTVLLTSLRGRWQEYIEAEDCARAWLRGRFVAPRARSWPTSRLAPNAPYVIDGGRDIPSSDQLVERV